VTFDLAVVGGGVAGWTAARRAQGLGLDVVVLEKSASPPGWGNGRLSAGMFHAAYLSPTRRPDEIYRAIMAKTDGHSREDVAQAWAQNCGRAFDFLQAEGGEFGRWGPEEYMSSVLLPFKPIELGQPWKGGGPDRLLTNMWRRFVDAGGTFRPEQPALELCLNAGAVVGVLTKRPGRGRELVSARAVLLADGGFQGNAEMVSRYITPAYKLRGADTDTGDGIRMGLAVGARVINMPWFYGHCLVKDALVNDRLWPQPSPQHVIEASVLVDSTGRRITDEGLGNQRNADAIAKSTTPGGCWVVFDDDVWRSVGKDGEIPLNPTILNEGGTVLTGSNVRELSQMAGLPAAALEETIATYNQHCRHGVSITPKRTGRALPIDRQPLYAIPLIAGITFTMGGLLINGNAEVVDQHDRPIPGLYAAGGTMGGLQGGPRSGYSGGWSEAATFGMLAAESVATRSRSPSRGV
jgi:fumarate reductase flavoprotein subunit